MDEADGAGTERPRAEGLLPTTSRGRWLVLAVLALALALRVAVVMENRAEYVPVTDSHHFDLIASSIAEGDGYGEFTLPPAVGPSAIRAPLYPVSLAAVYVVFGEGHWTMGRLANAAVGTAAVAMLGLVAAQLFGRRVAMIALALAAVHPAMILVGSSLNLEPLLVTLSLGALAAALQHRRDPHGLRWPIVAGVLLGLGALTRESALLFLPSLLWLVWSVGAERARRWSRAALAAPIALLLATVVAIAPWTIRNAIELDAFVPLTTSAGYGLVGTYNETSHSNTEDPALWIPPLEDPEVYEILVEMDTPTEVEVDEVLREHTIDFVLDHPTYPAKVAFWNTIRLFDLDGGDYSRFISEYVPYPLWLTRVAVLASYVVLAAAIVGAFLRRARRAPLAVWAIPAVTFAFMVVFLPASIRYRASLEPFFVMLASIAVVALADRTGWWPRRGAETAEERS